jgi:hypothetical protein
MYSLKCSYFDKEFNSLDELVDYVMVGGMDPIDGKGIGEDIRDYMVF